MKPRRAVKVQSQEHRYVLFRETGIPRDAFVVCLRCIRDIMLGVRASHIMDAVEPFLFHHGLNVVCISMFAMRWAVVCAWFRLELQV